jgi:hypothetical protein
MPTSYLDLPSCAQDGDGGRNILRDAQAEGHIVLRAEGDDPPKWRQFRPELPATGEMVPSPPQTHKQLEPLVQRILHHSGQITALFDQKGPSGTIFQACISWITSMICGGDPLAAPAPGLKISLARIWRSFEFGLLVSVSVIV